MQNLDGKKACQESDIPVKVKKTLDVISPLSTVTSTTVYSVPVSLQN